MNQQKSIQAQITLLQLKLNVNLGWPKAERIKKQKVLIDIELSFAEPPIGCITDNLKDTYCYADLVKLVQTCANQREFHLVEHLGHEIYLSIKRMLTPEMRVMVKITKKPAVLKYLTSGIMFCYGDA